MSQPNEQAYISGDLVDLQAFLARRAKSEGVDGSLVHEAVIKRASGGEVAYGRVTDVIVKGAAVIYRPR